MNVTPDPYVSPDFEDELVRSRDVEVVYRSDRVVVVNGSIRIGSRRYPIDRMRHVRIIRMRYRGLRLSRAVLAFMSFVAGMRVVDVLGPDDVVYALAFAALPVLALLVAGRRRQRVMITNFDDELGTLIICAKDPRRFNALFQAILAERDMGRKATQRAGSLPLQGSGYGSSDYRVRAVPPGR